MLVTSDAGHVLAKSEILLSSSCWRGVERLSQNRYVGVISVKVKAL
jgi:hypothetical protein